MLDYFKHGNPYRQRTSHIPRRVHHDAGLIELLETCFCLLWSLAWCLNHSTAFGLACSAIPEQSLHPVVVLVTLLDACLQVHAGSKYFCIPSVRTPESTTELWSPDSYVTDHPPCTLPVSKFQGTLIVLSVSGQTEAIVSWISHLRSPVLTP